MSAADSTTSAASLSLVAVFAALIGAFSLTPAIPIGPVPLTLQTLAVILVGLVLGPVRGLCANLLYLVVGFAGLPVFAGGTAGLAVLGKPSVGYLLAFPLGALVAGVVARSSVRWRGAKQYFGFFLAATAGTALIHLAGIAGLIAVAHLSFESAVLTDLVFWPGDLAKMAAAAAVAVAVHKAFPRLLLTGRTAAA